MSKSDRELLELAAKAAVVPAYWSTDGTLQARPIFVVSAGGRHGTMPFEEEWNPLKNDCDALRLAVKLGLIIDIDTEEHHTEIEFTSNYEDKSLSEGHGFDATAATRRAIVRAAASIGETLP